MAVLNSAPTIYSFEASADHENNPGKFTLKTVYRAYSGSTLIEIPVYRTQLFEDDTVDEEWWGEHDSDTVTPAWQAAGLSWT